LGDWRTTYDKSSILIKPTHYDPETIWENEVRDAIHEFHDLANNVVYDDKIIVVGHGAT